jgi:hypothetical protein
MKIRGCLSVSALIALASVISVGQNNCSVVPKTGVCPAAAPSQAFCASGGSTKGTTTCKALNWWGFATVAPATGTAGSQFEGIDASEALNPAPIVSPNGGIGPTVTVGSETQGQYFQFAGNYVQAFDKATGSPIFSNAPNVGPAVPQSFGTLFTPNAVKPCKSPINEGVAEYDRLDSAFVLGDIAYNATTKTYHYCFGISANNANGAISTSLQGPGNGKSYWNVYVYNITPALPFKGKGTRYYPAHPRFGSWSDGFYVTWDVLDPLTNNTIGLEACKLDKADILVGNTSKPPVCYTYIPTYAVGKKGTGDSLVHTLLPADFEGSNPIPSTTAGQYFMALVNPSNPGTTNPCTQSLCQSNQLAFWTWSGITSQTAPTLITTANKYTPGCYDPFKPRNTTCVPEPGYPTNLTDSVGDRLMHRLAYRVLGGNEYLAVSHTVEEDSTTARTGIRFYKIQAGSTPTIVVQSGSTTTPDVQDTTNGTFYIVPSVSMDNNGDLGITFASSGTAVNPSPYFVTTDTNGVLGTPLNICSGTGGCSATGEDESDAHWGPMVSTTTDPDDDLTFWGSDEYFSTNQAGCCTWQTRIFNGVQ